MTSTPTRMEIAARRPIARPSREIKVTLPHHMCVRLHSRKILTGTSIAQTVQDALEAYFGKLGAEGQPHPAFLEQEPSPATEP